MGVKGLTYSRARASAPFNEDRVFRKLLGAILVES